MKSTNPSINTVLILGAGELGLPILRAMSRQARLSPSLKISVLLRPEAARAVSGPLRARPRGAQTGDEDVVQHHVAEPKL